ncbi:MAG TPA: NAD(P)-binding protein [Acidimicrobiales bacterium]|nr:NAD(P)-binding protein [Acidimicrobiales bacterium]
MTTITIVGGGLAGLVAAIECAEGGQKVRLLEGHAQLGGRARSTGGDFHANFGPHLVYGDGALWTWLQRHQIALPISASPKAPKALVRHNGKARRRPPLALVRGLLGLRGKEAPADVDFQSWAAGYVGDETATLLARAAGVFTFDHDPGRLSAEFIVERGRRVITYPPTTRYVHGGWSTMIAALEGRARARGVVIETDSPVDALPATPVVVATELSAARRLLDDDTLRWTGTRTALLDVGLRARRGDPFLISDLDEAGWVERFSQPDPTLAPEGHSLVQAQVGLRMAESLESGVARLETLLDSGFAGWRDREVWRRRAVIDHRSGALDLPGTTWRDRPAVDRGDGIFLAGDMVAAPGLLGEVSVNSAVEAARYAVGAARGVARV